MMSGTRGPRTRFTWSSSLPCPPPASTLIQSVHVPPRLFALSRSPFICSRPPLLRLLLRMLAFFPTPFLHALPPPPRSFLPLYFFRVLQCTPAFASVRVLPFQSPASAFPRAYDVPPRPHPSIYIVLLCALLALSPPFHLVSRSITRELSAR
jgi:hypothetical protein